MTALTFPLAKLRVWWKIFYARHRLIIEFCHDCGVEQPFVWSAPDALWLRLMHRPGGVVCPTCFDKRAEAAGLLLMWTPAIEHEQGGNECR